MSCAQAADENNAATASEATERSHLGVALWVE